MAYFLTREDPVPARGGGKRCSYDNNDGNPGSPLSRLVQDGYVGMPTGGRPPRQPSQTGFHAGIADQWSSNVQNSVISHQQEHDPNIMQLPRKTSGTRVSQGPGGQSSLSLAWDGGDAEPPRRGRGAGMDRPAAQPLGHVDVNVPSQGGPKPGAYGSRASSRESGMSGCLGGASYGDAAYERQPFGGGGGHRNYSPAPPVESTGLTFGSRAGHTSSNAYACGTNQNVGNGITDRRTTTVLQPPGGRSQISFG
mmetsp:Transcript_10309/g.18366  ORF Transcript_10309/g.18366 Transcript_10309/m.18366 type:complete len:252 (-) Transcript_10309:99-854(-)|eukprot:CAMPEP_0197659508 /NCGR_PEP_ID=MMETSP1338-20131121/47948_1 /TAXON_ID=43686 ORGANISM="Pelagodinium beii, Strain RCC1491" /NCGR_SAMPLE_ID=MMETSP1338 /ASSEMBLY_ACC=CAM_ASM_000754 /LENGTH=251 /DNA_ID=CAMNT_0043236461 /DNA_START=51 /DNA_END=806 /DNA_ORIENTATION=-